MPLSNESVVNILLEAIEQDIITLGDVKNELTRKKRNHILKMHEFTVWQATDGRWCTYLPSEDSKSKRRRISKKSKEVLEDSIVEFYLNIDKQTARAHITLHELYPEWLEFKGNHTNADTYIKRINTEWKRHYEGTAIIERPITELKKLDFDEWAHKLIKDNNMTKKEYYNTTVIMRQTLDCAVDKEIVSDNLFRKVRIDGKRLFRKVRKPKSYTQVFNQLELEAIEKMAWEEYRNKSRKWELSPWLTVPFSNRSSHRRALCSSSL